MPYIAGLIPLLRLWSLIDNTVMGYIALGIITLTTLIDVFLLIMFFFYYRLVRHGPVGLLVKLLVFSLFRTVFCAISVAGGVTEARIKHGHFDQVPLLIDIGATLYISQSFHPLLIFVLFGLHRDILQFWFPCILSRRRNTNSESIDSISRVSTTNGQVVYEIRPIELPGPVESSYNIAAECVLHTGNRTL